ncbi:MAG: hypothetical protein K1X54_04545 [Flavobacteriales bacterium]|nr:hypothetical protein [Flavobacteriales bacterium]
MTAIQFYSTQPEFISPVIFQSSAELAEILFKHRFVEINSNSRVFHFIQGKNYFFRNNGQCTVNFLKDGRVHVLHGPIALWNLHDFLTSDELTVLLAFSKLSSEHQELMRNYMGSRCTKFTDVMRNIPSFEVDWKEAYLKAFASVSF